MTGAMCCPRRLLRCWRGVGGACRLMALLLLASWCLWDIVQAQTPIEEHSGRRELLNMLLNASRSYDPRVPPDYEEDYATNVTIKIHVLSFDSISETTMDYSMELFLTMSWIDGRLNFENKSKPLNWNKTNWLEVDTKMMDKSWVPDLYFRNEKEGSFHDVTVPNKFMHIFANGTVNYSMRLSLTLSCRMDLAKYPLDTQKCPMMIQSYTYTVENVRFFWDQHAPISFESQMASESELPQFKIIRNQTELCDNNMGDTNFACIRAHFHLQRDIRYYIIQVYVPSILIVALSWVSFWLDLEAIPARVTLGVLTVLTLNTHGSNVQQHLPKVSYIKAIDVWTVVCLIFVFSALLEFAYVNVMSRRGIKERERALLLKQQCECGEGEGLKVGRDETTLPSTTPCSHCTCVPRLKRTCYSLNGSFRREPSAADADFVAPGRHRARMVDKVSRVAFPSAFILFNVIYWVVYGVLEY